MEIKISERTSNFIDAVIDSICELAELTWWAMKKIMLLFIIGAAIMILRGLF